MASYTLSPSLVFKGFYDDNSPLVGGKVFTWLAGTDTPVDTYQSNGGAANTNPVILNARGEANIWLDPSISYKIEVQDDEGNIVIPAKDNITVGDTSGLNAITIDNVSDLRAYSGSATLLYLKGYFSPNDGCGGWLYFSSTSTRPDDGVINFSPNSAPPTGRYIRDYTGGPISIRYGGDAGTNEVTDDSLDRCLAYIATYGGTLYHPPGIYKYDADHTVPCKWVCDDKAFLSVNTAATLTVTNELIHPPTSFFTRPTGYLGAVSLSGAKGTVAYPEWFGATGAGTGDDRPAIVLCFATACFLYSFPSDSGYQIASTVTLPGDYLITARLGVFESGPTYQIFAGISASGSMRTQGSIVSAGDISGENLNANANINAGGDANITGAVNSASVSTGAIVGSTISGTDITASGSLDAGTTIDAGGDITTPGNIYANNVNATGGVIADGTILAGVRLKSTAGAGTAKLAAGGMLYADVTQSSSVGAGPTTLGTYTIPANTLASDGSQIIIKAYGQLANNGNTKAINFDYAGAATFTITTTTTGYWKMTATLIKSGANMLVVSDSAAYSFPQVLVDAAFANALIGTLNGSNRVVSIYANGTSNGDILCNNFSVFYNPQPDTVA